MDTNDSELTAEEIETRGLVVDEDGDLYNPDDARWIEPAGDAE